MKDLAQLRKDLARLLGTTPDDAEEDGELDFIDTCINTAYAKCFTDIHGKRPRWATKQFSLSFSAPVSVTATLTQGSTAIGSPSEDPDPKYAGSYVRIGRTFYVYAGKDDAGTHHLLEPWPESTGERTLTVFQNSCRLDASTIQLLESPELVGWGSLSPLHGREAEVRYRSLMRGDFDPAGGIGNRSRPLIHVGGSTQQEGKPWWYFLDPSSITPEGEGFDPAYRFCVYPVPDEAEVVRFRASVVPAPLKKADEKPQLVADMVDTILLPIARAECAGGSKHYNGKNLEFLVRKAEEAEHRLRTLANDQRRKGGRIRVRPGWY